MKPPPSDEVFHLAPASTGSGEAYAIVNTAVESIVGSGMASLRTQGNEVDRGSTRAPHRAEIGGATRHVSTKSHYSTVFFPPEPTLINGG